MCASYTISPPHPQDPRKIFFQPEGPEWWLRSHELRHLCEKRLGFCHGSSLRVTLGERHRGRERRQALPHGFLLHQLRLQCQGGVVTVLTSQSFLQKLSLLGCLHHLVVCMGTTSRGVLDLQAADGAFSASSPSPLLAALRSRETLSTEPSPIPPTPASVGKEDSLLVPAPRWAGAPPCPHQRLAASSCF